MSWESEMLQGPIVEGLVTSVGPDGQPHVAPMGPATEPSWRRLLLRPFPGSATYANLKRTGQGVFHVTDDVELLARSAVGRLAEFPAVQPAGCIEGYILQDACRWYAFVIRQWEDRRPRAHAWAEVVAQGRLRDFLGFNRAKHAVLEAAIIATRLHLMPAEEVRSELDRLAPIVEKTAAEQERRAFAFLQEYVERELASQAARHAVP
jgi:hypothetical protein